MSDDLLAIIQARMSSSRYPGKSLAPLAGVPVVERVIDRVREVLPPQRIVVATSDRPSDDPLASYIETMDVDLFRGSLHDVVARFRSCLQDRRCRWFIRICGDSPILDPSVIRSVLNLTHQHPDADIVTNVYERTFPAGQSVEVVRRRAFLSLDHEALSDAEREHVTKVFYDHPDDYEIVNVESSDPDHADEDTSVDTLDDLRRLEERIRAEGGLMGQRG